MFNNIMKNLNIRQKFGVLFIYVILGLLPYIAGASVLIVMLGGDDGWDTEYLIRWYLLAATGYTVLYIAVAIAMGRTMIRQVGHTLRETAENVKKVSEGDLNVVFEYDTKDEVSLIIETLRDMEDSIRKETEVVTRIANGDYTEEISLRGEQDVIYKSLKDLQNMNNGFISEIKHSAVQISSGASQIASGAQSLAEGSNQQAATIEEFSVSMADIKLKADENARIAQGTLRDIKKNTHLMQENIDEIKRVNGFIDEFSKDSKQIATVIKVIDDIAFQTNILALNAAVEAARAGQHGRGFAVVADEVRELASKSAQAAKETSALINKSLSSVSEGSRLVEKTNAGIKQMGEIALKNENSMTKMSEASIEQGESISEIDKGIAQISNVVSANSSMAEESAAAANEMSAQADRLNMMISRFKIREDSDKQLFDGTEGMFNVGLGMRATGIEVGEPSADIETKKAKEAEEDLQTGFRFVDATGPELEDFSNIEIPDKYSNGQHGRHNA